MGKQFDSPLYNVTMNGGAQVTIDVTNSISAGLAPNKGLIDGVVTWMKDRGYTRVLDFGAGALRHTIPLLKAGLEVTAVEYEQAYERPKCYEARVAAQKFSGFAELVWPKNFLNSRGRYDVVLLVFVLQVIPVKAERALILDAIAKRFDRDGAKRLYYASRFGEGASLPDETRYNDGWVRGVHQNDRTFYTEWNAGDTDAFFKARKFVRGGRYDGASQPYIYDYSPGVF
jgi:hypothetical protein